MLSKKYGWKRIKLIPIESKEQHYEIASINFKILNKQIIRMEKEVWGSDSDPDLKDIPLWNSFMIHSEDYILGYILLSKRFYKNGYSSWERKKYTEGCQIGICIDDFVVLNMRKAVPFTSIIIDKIKEALDELKPDFIICNPNSFSKPFIKRLEKLGYPIKFNNYRPYNPEGYKKMKGSN